MQTKNLLPSLTEAPKGSQGASTRKVGKLLETAKSLGSKPQNTYELFFILEKLTPKGLRILHQIVWFSSKYQNNFVGIKKLAKNANCSDRTIKRLKKKFNHILFTINRRFGETDIFVFEKWLLEELQALVTLCGNHLENFSDKNKKQELFEDVYCKNLSFKDIRKVIDKKREDMNKSEKKCHPPSDENVTLYSPSWDIPIYKKVPNNKVPFSKEEKKEKREEDTFENTSKGLIYRLKRDFGLNYSAAIQISKTFGITSIESAMEDFNFYKNHGNKIRSPNYLMFSLAKKQQHRINSKAVLYEKYC